MARRAVVDTSEAQSFEPVQPGPYQMTVDEVSDPEKGEKSTYVWIHFRFEDPALDKKAGRVRRAYPISGKGAGFFREVWKATTGEDLPIGQTGLDVDLDAPLGRHVTVSVGNETYEGRLQNTVEKVVAAA